MKRYRARTVIGQRLQTDRRYRIVITAALSLVVNLLYGLGHAVLGLIDGSVWLLVMAAYYILLGGMRFGAVWTERRQSSEQFVMRLCGGMLMALAVVLGVTTAISLAQENAAPHSLVVMLMIATYTFYKMTMAIVHGVQAHQSGTPLTRTIRNITLASALASLMTMQRSMLVSFEGEATQQDKLILNALTGGAVFAVVFLMGLNMLFDEKGFDWIAKSALTKIGRRFGRAVACGYKRVEGAVVSGYQWIEGGVVKGYRRIEDRFVGRFLAREGESIGECRARLRGEAAKRTDVNAARTSVPDEPLSAEHDE